MVDSYSLMQHIMREKQHHVYLTIQRRITNDNNMGWTEIAFFDNLLKLPRSNCWISNWTMKIQSPEQLNLSNWRYQWALPKKKWKILEHNVDATWNKMIVSKNCTKKMVKGLLQSIQIQIPMAQINWARSACMIVVVFSSSPKRSTVLYSVLGTWLDEIIKIAEDMCFTLFTLCANEMNAKFSCFFSLSFFLFSG